MHVFVGVSPTLGKRDPRLVHQVVRKVLEKQHSFPALSLIDSTDRHIPWWSARLLDG